MLAALFCAIVTAVLTVFEPRVIFCDSVIISLLLLFSICRPVEVIRAIVIIRILFLEPLGVVREL